MCSQQPPETNAHVFRSLQRFIEDELMFGLPSGLRLRLTCMPLQLEVSEYISSAVLPECGQDTQIRDTGRMDPQPPSTSCHRIFYNSPRPTLRREYTRPRPNTASTESGLLLALLSGCCLVGSIAFLCADYEPVRRTAVDMLAAIALMEQGQAHAHRLNEK